MFCDCGIGLCPIDFVCTVIFLFTSVAFLLNIKGVIFFLKTKYYSKKFKFSTPAIITDQFNWIINVDKKPKDIDFRKIYGRVYFDGYNKNIEIYFSDYNMRKDDYLLKLESTMNLDDKLSNVAQAYFLKLILDRMNILMSRSHVKQLILSMKEGSIFEVKYDCSILFICTIRISIYKI